MHGARRDALSNVAHRHTQSSGEMVAAVGQGLDLYMEALANQSAANSRIVSITFIDIDPLGPDDLLSDRDRGTIS